MSDSQVTENAAPVRFQFRLVHVFYLMALLGACLSLFPATVADRWGTRNLGLNYGILFTAWGVGGFVLPRVQQMLYEASKDAAGKGSYTSSFIVASVLLVVGTALTFLIKPPARKAA